MTEDTNASWKPCYADPERGVAFFDGVTIEADSLTDPRWDRVIPVFEEEQVFMCRQMEPLLKGQAGALVLDLETGSGVLAVWAALCGCRVVAVDSNPRALRMARQNAARNRVKVVEREEDLADGSIWFCWDDFADWQGDFVTAVLRRPVPWASEGTFDFVFLSPPYTPTCPGVWPAQHAAAGPDGQEAFKKRIQLAPLLLKEGGHCIGNQMTVVKPGGELMAVTVIQEAFQGQAEVRYTRMIEPTRDRSVRKFLESQYRSYRSMNLWPTQKGVDEYIEQVDPQDNLRFALIYYDARKTASAADPAVTDLRDQGPVPAPEEITWKDRTHWHRCIVDHTSSQNTLPTPALLLRNAPLARMPVHPGAESGSRPSGRPGREWDWIRGAISEFAQRSWMVMGDQPDFDFVFVDSAPWYRNLKGYKALPQFVQLLVCQPLQREDVIGEMLAAYQANVFAMHERKLGPFLHPAFMGTVVPGDWRNVQSSVVDHSEPIWDVEAQERPLVDGLLEEVRISYDGITRSPDEKEPVSLRLAMERQGIHFSTGSMGGSSWTDLEALNIEMVDEYEKEMKNRVGNLKRLLSEAGLRVPPDEPLAHRDLKLAHLVLHQRLMTVLQGMLSSAESPRPERGRWSALVGLPLHLAFSLTSNGSRGQESGPRAGEASETYRGGVWVFACSRQRWDLRLEGKLFDLVRFLWYFFASHYNYQAGDNLASITRVELARNFGHEVKQVANALAAKWLVAPEERVRRAISSLATPPAWAERPDWQVVPFPELLVVTGKMIRLWCQLNNPRDFFDNIGDGGVRTMRDLILSCWRIAKDSIKPLLCRGKSLSLGQERIHQVCRLLREVEGLWASDDLLLVEVGDVVPGPDWEDGRRVEQWMNLTRLFATWFVNCVRHADPHRRVTIRVTQNKPGVLVFTVENYEDSKETPKRNGLSEAVNSARELVSTAPWRDGGDQDTTEGARVFERIVTLLGGETTPPHYNGDRILRAVRIPLRTFLGESDDERNADHRS